MPPAVGIGAMKEGEQERMSLALGEAVEIDGPFDRQAPLGEFFPGREIEAAGRRMGRPGSRCPPWRDRRRLQFRQELIDSRRLLGLGKNAVAPLEGHGGTRDARPEDAVFRR